MIVGMQDEARRCSATRTSRSARKAAADADRPREPLLEPIGSRSAGRRTPQDPADPATTGRSTTAPSVRGAERHAGCCSRSWARRVGERRQGEATCRRRTTRPAQLRLRGRHALQRPYIPNTDGSTRRYLPAVRYWPAWNEPNNPILLAAGRRADGASARASYARICNAIWQGVHSTNFAGEKVACGVTAPAREQQRRVVAAVGSPVAFLRATKAPGCGPRRLRAPPVLRRAERDAERRSPGGNAVDAREHQHADRRGEPALGQEAPLDHRVRLPDARPTASSASRMRTRRATCARRSRSRGRTRAST